MTSLPVAPLLSEIFGTGEIVLIFLLVLMLFGPEKLPEFARGLGKVMREFRKAASDVEREFKTAMDEAERKKADAALPVTPVSATRSVAQESPALSAPAPVAPAPAAPTTPPDDSAHIDA